MLGRTLGVAALTWWVLAHVWPTAPDLAQIILLAVFVTTGAVETIFNRLRASQRQNRERLLLDADYQHWHALWGNRRTAVYGRFQP